jgi:mannose-6-phosphate isomerase-like protein (cupin superfamily)
MRTIEISEAEMSTRIARFSELKSLEVQKNTNIPRQAADIVWARKLLSVIGLDQDIDTPINASAPIVGAGGITITFASCPPGTGPSLHSHRKTYETFTVMQGRFEVFWNDNGENRVELGHFDTIAVPPGVCRGFRNIGAEEGILQVIISGGVHDLNDIDFAPKCAEEIENIKPGLLKTFQETGLTFTASKDYGEE